MALTEFFHAVASVHPLPVSWYLISSLRVYLCSRMHIMSMLWSTADAASSGNCPILFKVLTLNVVICVVRLHFSNFCFSLSSAADFSNTDTRAPTPAGRVPFFTRAKSDAVWTGGLSMGHGNLSLAVFILIYISHSIEEQQQFPDRTIWSWTLNRRIHTPRAWLGITLNRQMVHPLAFTSTMLLPMAFEKRFFFANYLQGCS